MDTAQLRDLQALPLKYKIMISQERIREWYEHWDGKVYVSFSGGKDSTVLLHLVRQLYPEVPAVFVDTGLEYPEIRQFVKQHDNVVWLRPKMNFKEVIIRYGFPVASKRISQYIHEIQTPTDKNKATVRLRLTGIRTSGKYSACSIIPEKWRCLKDAPFKVSDQCCGVMKKKPFDNYVAETGQMPYAGVMASDAQTRELDYLQSGCNAFDKKRPISRPLGFWMEADIWEYLHKNNVPYSPIYDMGFTRTGCMFCMFGVHLEPEPNRFQKMQVTHPKQWEYCMFKLGLAEVLDYIGVPWNDSNQLWSTEEILKGGSNFDH
jgi:3'-phosphoadenosine 5'-phosphosulfate sulfotransferase (PAPS reductase)/FAD synthetase